MQAASYKKMQLNRRGAEAQRKNANPHLNPSSAIFAGSFADSPQAMEETKTGTDFLHQLVDITEKKGKQISLATWRLQRIPNVIVVKL